MKNILTKSKKKGEKKGGKTLKWPKVLQNKYLIIIKYSNKNFPYLKEKRDGREREKGRQGKGFVFYFP